MKLRLDKYQNKHSLRSKVARLIWNVVWRAFGFIMPHKGLGFLQRFLLRVFGGTIGKRSRIFGSSKIWQPWKIKIGNYSIISARVNCYSVDSITMGDHVVISEGAFLCTASHDINSATMELVHKPITIESQVWIAAKAFIGPGVKIGEGAVVGAYAVVTKDVEPWTVVAGNPAKVVKKRVLREEANH